MLHTMRSFCRKARVFTGDRGTESGVGNAPIEALMEFINGLGPWEDEAGDDPLISVDGIDAEEEEEEEEESPP